LFDDLKISQHRVRREISEDHGVRFGRGKCFQPKSAGSVFSAFVWIQKELVIVTIRYRSRPHQVVAGAFRD
jgi:hypothetical protein